MFTSDVIRTAVEKKGARTAASTSPVVPAQDLSPLNFLHNLHFDHLSIALSDPVPSVFSIDDVVSLVRQENAKDICVIKLPPEIKYSNYFIIASGSSARHLHAMAQYLVKMYKYMKKDTDPHVVIEGKETDDWLCIDFGNIVVHFMLPETREIYELEKLWTLRSNDDQLAQMATESLPDDFVFGLDSKQQ